MLQYHIIKPCQDIVKLILKDTEFDHHWDARIRENMASTGADGALLTDNDHDIYRVNLIEKLWLLYWQKCPILFPKLWDGSNTQRPEWNDANNALGIYGLYGDIVLYDLLS